MKKAKLIQDIIDSRKHLRAPFSGNIKKEEEGGCGVTGFACSIPVKGRHIFEPSRQMHNRGNGLGGGIAAMGLDPEALGVSREILEQDYMIQVAVLDRNVLDDLKNRYIDPWFDIHSSLDVPHIRDFKDIPGLVARPPGIWRFFIRVKPEVLDDFVEKNGLSRLTSRQAEDEFVYRNSFKINRRYYDVSGTQSAFVVSHGRNFLILKIVGYAEQVVEYYQMEDLKAHIWLAHQRYPTKGKVWHPGGAHPFIGLNEALVHNGDFANYHSVVEYLRQRNIHPLFLTDTEVSVLLFDLYSRVYGYPLEYIIEALAPTMERDFDQLVPEKQGIYRAIQATHIHGSPDGPWFFIIARNDADSNRYQLIGVTDTSMLRPQVFALHEGDIKLGLVCSEKQAIDATLKSLSREDPRIGTVADRYWNARGGSHTDGGAFIFNLDEISPGLPERSLTCTNKFGNPVAVPEEPPYLSSPVPVASEKSGPDIGHFFNNSEPEKLYEYVKQGIGHWDPGTLARSLKEIKNYASKGEHHFQAALSALTSLVDHRYATFKNKRRFVLHLANETLNGILRACPRLDQETERKFRLISLETRDLLRKPGKGEEVLVIDSSLFPPEGNASDGRLMAEAFHMGWGRFIVFGLRGQRFHGCGLGPGSGEARIDIFGSSGDYLGSGIDGLSIYVHGNAQDQVGQIMKSGKMVIYGDVGQTFLYGAKGGEVYVMGNAAGRPLINAVGRPRVVINGTCLDYLAESFMAGDPLNGGGFVILNGLELDEHGRIRPLEDPYPGSNLFSLASGGAIYIRDPLGKVDKEQLNGGEIVDMENRDWFLILPYLKENEELFGISVEKDLLAIEGKARNPLDIYRKVRPEETGIEESGLEEWGEC